MSKGKFIAVANMKGGVGKTTTVVSLAEFLARNGSTSVLIVDLDPQASASTCIVGDATLAELIRTGRTIDAFIAVKLIKKADSSLDKRIRRGCCTVTSDGHPVLVNLIPTSSDLRLVERELLRTLVKKRFDFDQIDRYLADFLAQNILPLRDEFDYIIFDCAPGISSLTEVAIRASDLVIVPTIPDRLSASGLVNFCELVTSGGATGSARVPLLRILLTRVQQTKQHRILAERIEALDVEMFETRIPQCAALVNGLVADDNRPFYVPTFKVKYGPVMSPIMEKLASEVRSLTS